VATNRLAPENQSASIASATAMRTAATSASECAALSVNLNLAAPRATVG
jgi:hypothetical protein